MGQWLGCKSRPGPPWAASPGLVLHGRVDQGRWQSCGLEGIISNCACLGKILGRCAGLGGATSAMGVLVWGDIRSRHAGPAGLVRARQVGTKQQPLPAASLRGGPLKSSKMM